MEVAETKEQISTSTNNILSCEITEAGDAIFKCFPNVYAGTDAVKMFRAVETTEVGCTIQPFPTRFGTPEFSQDPCDFLTRIQVVCGKSTTSTPFVENVTAMTEVGDAIFECCPIVYAETDEVQLWHAAESTKFRCSVRIARLPKPFPTSLVLQNFLKIVVGLCSASMTWRSGYRVDSTC